MATGVMKWMNSLRSSEDMRRYHGEESAPETISKLTSLIAGDLGLPIEYPIVIDTLENLGG